MQKFSLLQAFSALHSCRFTRRRQTLQHTLIPQSSMRRQTMQQCCDHSYCRLMQNCSCTLSPSDLQRCFCSPRPGAARQAPPKTGRERVDRAPRGDGADGAGGRLLRADPLRLRRAARRALDGYPRFYPPCPHRFPVCSSSEQQICGHGEQG